MDCVPFSKLPEGSKRLWKLKLNGGRVRYFVFDLLCHKGRDLTGLPLIERWKILGTLTLQSEWVRIADYFEASSDKLLHAAREQQLEGIVGKLRDTHYEPGKRNGASTIPRFPQPTCGKPMKRALAPSLVRSHCWMTA
jgi:ATP-dependent DNA ligase